MRNAKDILSHEKNGLVFVTGVTFEHSLQSREPLTFEFLYVLLLCIITLCNRPFHVKRWNVGSLLIKRDVTAGVHFRAILSRIYIAAYGKMRKL